MLDYIVMQIRKVNHEKGYCTGRQIKQSGIESCSEQNTLLLQYFSPSRWMVYGCQMVGGLWELIQGIYRLHSGYRIELIYT